MAHRIYRLAISFVDDPAVRRVIDFDGRASLWDVHVAIHRSLTVGDDDPHQYGFYLSGKFFDPASEYGEPDAGVKNAANALLFRLGLEQGQRFVYLYDYTNEWRFTLEVVAITDAEKPLADFVLVESTGDMPPYSGNLIDEPDGDDEADDQLLARITPLVKSLLEHKDAASALSLAKELQGSVALLQNIDEYFEASPSLLEVLFDLGLQLSSAGKVEDALSVVSAYAFAAPSELNGDRAIIFARAGRRDEALAQVEHNLEHSTYPYVTEFKAGDVYRALDEPEAAEAYYRRALVEAESDVEYREGVVRLTSLLVDLGREEDAAKFLEEAQRGLASPPEKKAPLPVAAARSVGRNDPCPCGSGKKYKKCHGA